MDQQSMIVNGAVPKYSEKHEKFKGLDFKRWQQKMLFFLTTMNLSHVVKEEAPKSNENPMTKETIMAIEAWNHSEFCCRNYILNSLDGNLYDIYSLCKIAKELWESLEKKYKIDNAGSKKFVINKFLKYTMVDSKSVVSQHKRREMNMEDLILRLQVEEDHRKADRFRGFAAIETNANYVEGGNSKAKPKKNKTPKTNQFVQSALVPKESADVEFFEDIFPYKEKESGSNTKRVHDHSHDEASSSGVQDVEPRRGKRIKVSKNFGPDFIAFLSENEPRTFKEAMSSSKAPLWKEAIKSEMESILENNTWELVDLPPGSKLIGHKWIFKKKLKADGTIDKFKTRLVAKGYCQKEGLDYFDTYSPVSRITSIRTLIAIAVVYNFDIHQMDGLKQAPKQWHEKFDHTLFTHGFKINESNKCVYIKSNDKTCVIVCLYVDDMLIMESDKDVINKTKKMLNSNFDMKDLGQADVILGIQIKRNSEGYVLTQSHYAEKILRRFGQFDCKPAATPFDAGCNLMYLMNSTRHGLAYAVNRLSRYTSNPAQEHCDALVRVLRYLKNILDYGLHYTKYSPVAEGFSDANWISDTTESKSTTISWKSSKQKCIARFNTESEFTALDLAREEAKWLKNFLEDIPIWPKPITAICIHCDNMTVQSRTKSHVYNGKLRHIRRRHNTLKKLLSNGIISIDYVKSKENIQILFTSRGMGLKPIQ
ncbi:hypothetical protein D8674_030942 [Pyrus ussuriensis x Pyrus communis]|uniref:Reverse transcriptase Ty1/copia-type domain-containing protein n=1 Tax=Pyrus ussuriensis x Pyrus communis TaxID=2448454 RepID=A0A5N5F2K7_9ROSA|nr:hypothetical protein D8674_030942 [Pyrus ussuriensis x Pyrus communis]